MPTEAPKSFMLVAFYGREGDSLNVEDPCRVGRSSTFGLDTTLAQAWNFADQNRPFPNMELKEIQMFPHMPDKAKEPANGD